MTIARSIAAVVIGYLIFALSAAALFQLSGRPPHQPAPMGFMLLSIGYGSAFAFLGGYVAGWLGQRRPLVHGCAVAGLLALGAVFSLVSTLGKGAIWTRLRPCCSWHRAPCWVGGLGPGRSTQPKRNAHR